MNARVKGRGPMMVAATILVALALTAGASRAKAVCCTSVLIDNLTTCSYLVCIDDGSATGYCQTMNPGSNFIYPPDCYDESLVFVWDVWGNRNYLPVAAGGSINVWVTTACCVKFTKKTVACFWEATFC